MKEIGETLKEARESIGVSVEEVAGDLKVRPSQIQNIEDGNMKAFKDILYVKAEQNVAVKKKDLQIKDT